MKSRGRRLLSVLMALVLCLGMLPGAVWAEGEQVITFLGTVQNNNGVTTVTYKVNNTDVVVTLKSGMTIDMEDGQDGHPKKTLTLENGSFLTGVVESINGFDAGTMEIRAMGSNNFSTTLTWDSTSKQFTLPGETVLPGAFSFVIQQKNNGGNNPQPGDSDHGPGPGDEHTFSGTAYFVWDNGESLGIKKIENIKGRGQSGGYEINYINASDFGFANGVSVESLAANGHYFWVAADKVTVTNEGNSESYSIQGSNNSTITTWSELESYINSLGEDGKRAFAYDPTGGRNGTHSISTNGDRNFRATIYESGFEGIQFSADMSDYTYFPGFWDPTFFSSTIDISGSTKTYPAIYETYLREPNITFYNVEQSTSPITAVKALDVPDGVVTVGRNNSNGFTIEFHSNYYDHVVFELTAENNAKYYVMLARTVLQAHDNFGPDMTWTPEISAEVWYPSSDVAEGKDECPYEVVAYVHYNDESTVVQKLSAVQMPVEEGSSEMKFVLTPTDGAKGLSYSTFTLPIGTAGQRLDEITVVGISYTVVKKESGEDFSGVMSGSGRGTYYDVANRMIDYWK